MGAEVLMGEVLAVRRRTLGDEHPHTLRSMSISNLAALCYRQGDYRKALPLATEAAADF